MAAPLKNRYTFVKMLLIGFSFGLILAFTENMIESYVPVLEDYSREVTAILLWIIGSVALFKSGIITEYFDDSHKKEKYYFQPYSSTWDQLQVFGSIALLGLLPLMIIYLLVPPAESIVPIIVAGLFYLAVMAQYAILLLLPRYSRIFTNLISGKWSVTLFVFIVVFAGMYLQDIFSYFTPAQIGLIFLSIGLTVYGIVMLLQTSRNMADKKTQAENELAFAGEVQQRLLQDKSMESPSNPEESSSYKISAFGRSVPSRQLGGDFFSLYNGSNGKIYAAVGDVAGHSFGAGLIMTMLKTSLENYLSMKVPADEILARLNQQLFRQGKDKIFATLGLVEADSGSGYIRWYNAGHMPLLWYQADQNELKEVRSKGLALGMAARADYTNPTGIEISSGGCIDTLFRRAG